MSAPSGCVGTHGRRTEAYERKRAAERVLKGPRAKVLLKVVVKARRHASPSSRAGTLRRTGVVRLANGAISPTLAAQLEEYVRRRR